MIVGKLLVSYIVVGEWIDLFGYNGRLYLLGAGVNGLLHSLELLADADETNADVFSTDADDLANLFVAHVFEPEEDDGAIENAELVDAFVEKAYLLVVLAFVAHLFGADTDGFERRSLAFALFALSVGRDAGVHGNAPNPGADFAASFKLVVAFPKIYEGLLHQVFYFVVAIGEHETHGVDGALLFPDEAGEFCFLLGHGV